MGEFLQGATFALSVAAALFFLKFWRQTGDQFFVLFALAFAADALSRALLGTFVAAEHEPLIYLGRLVMFGLIIYAILRKNRES